MNIKPEPLPSIPKSATGRTMLMGFGVGVYRVIGVPGFRVERLGLGKPPFGGHRLPQ